MDDRFYDAKEEYREKFFRLPKVFMTNPKYKKLSSDAKIAWAILRDRHELSIKNKWFDKQNKIYFLYSREKLAEILGLSPKSVTKVRKELKQAELILVKRQGQGKTDMLYLLKPELRDEDIYLIQDTEEINESEEEDREENPAKSIGRVEKGKIYTSRSVNFTHLEGKNLHTSDTESNDTESNDTEIFVNKGKNNSFNTFDITDLKNIANEFYAIFATGRWSKEEWHTIVDQLIYEIMQNNRHESIPNMQGYIRQCLKNIAYKHDLKDIASQSQQSDSKSERDTSIYYNWLEELKD